MPKLHHFLMSKDKWLGVSSTNPPAFSISNPSACTHILITFFFQSQRTSCPHPLFEANPISCSPNAIPSHLPQLLPKSLSFSYVFNLFLWQWTYSSFFFPKYKIRPWPWLLFQSWPSCWRSSWHSSSLLPHLPFFPTFWLLLYGFIGTASIEFTNKLHIWKTWRGTFPHLTELLCCIWLCWWLCNFEILSSFSTCGYSLSWFPCTTYLSLLQCLILRLALL